jgi:hypothetical protein
MNTRNLLIASLIGAVVTVALTSIPFVNVLVCVLCLPLWGGPLLAAWYYKRETGVMTMNNALSVGALTGLIAGILAVIVGLMVGASGMTQQLTQYLPEGSVPPEALAAAAPSVLGSLLGILFYIFFGVIGGLIGGAIFKEKTTPPAPPVA